MRKQIILYFTTFLFLLNVNCSKKTADNLPPATQTGANTFGCLIDGNAWIPEGRGVASGIYPTSGGFFGEVDNTISIYIKAYGPSDQIVIYLKSITAPGTYSLNKNTDIKPNVVLPQANYGAYVTVSGPKYVTDSLHSGTVVITHADLNDLIVSGTFNMKVYQKIQAKLSTLLTEGLTIKLIKFFLTTISLCLLTIQSKILRLKKRQLVTKVCE